MKCQTITGGDAAVMVLLQVGLFYSKWYTGAWMFFKWLLFFICPESKEANKKGITEISLFLTTFHLSLKKCKNGRLLPCEISFSSVSFAHESSWTSSTPLPCNFGKRDVPGLFLWTRVILFSAEIFLCSLPAVLLFFFAALSSTF